MAVFGRLPRSLLPGIGVVGAIPFGSEDSLLLAPAAGAASPPDNGLGGRLVVLTPPRGGCGKAFILIVLRIDFPAPFTPGVVSRVFGSGVLPDIVAEGSEDVEGARNALRGRLGIEPGVISEGVGMLPVLLRVFFVGKAGNAVVGGPKDGLDGRGIEAMIEPVYVVKIQIFVVVIAQSWLTEYLTKF